MTYKSKKETQIENSPYLHIFLSFRVNDTLDPETFPQEKVEQLRVPVQQEQSEMPVAR